MKLGTKTNKGITLVALVVTILVIFMISGVTLSIISGDSGILPMGVSAKDETDISHSIEQAQVDIIEKIAEKNGEKINENEVREILKRYFKENDVNNIRDFSADTVRTKNGNIVNVADIVGGLDIKYNSL